MLIQCAKQLSIATLSTLFVGSWAMSGGKKADAQKGPPINASSKDEEDFVQYVGHTPSTSLSQRCPGTSHRENGVTMAQC